MDPFLFLSTFPKALSCPSVFHAMFLKFIFSCNFLKVHLFLFTMRPFRKFSFFHAVFKKFSLFSCNVFFSPVELNTSLTISFFLQLFFLTDFDSFFLPSAKHGLVSSFSSVWRSAATAIQLSPIKLL